MICIDLNASTSFLTNNLISQVTKKNLKQPEMETMQNPREEKISHPVLRKMSIQENYNAINLIENQPDTGKIYLYAKDPYECKCQYLINKTEGVGINHFKDLRAFIEYSNDMHNVYKNINHYNNDKENKILIVLDVMINDMIQNKS